MFKAYMYKLMHSPLLCVGIIGVMVLCCTNFLTYDFTRGTVVSHVQNFLDIGLYRKVMTVFGALPFTANFADEWTSGTTVNCIVRKGIKKYVTANILFCTATTMFTVFCGMMLFCIGYSFFVPVYIPNSNPYDFIFGQFLFNNQGDIYLTLRILIFSASCAMWSMTGMLLSALLTNKYVAICAPFVASYVVERITIQFPADFNLWYLSLSFVSFKSDLIGFLYCFGIFIAISAICGYVFFYLARKRVENEIL